MAPVPLSPESRHRARATQGRKAIGDPMARETAKLDAVREAAERSIARLENRRPASLDAAVTKGGVDAH